MPKEVMRRQAADNEYLHKDFHGALSRGLDFLGERYGADAVTSYLRRFAMTYYAPLREELLHDGLSALRKHFENIYAIEGGVVSFTESPDELVIDVEACPAVTHMRSLDVPVSPYWIETTRTVGTTLCEGTPYASELVSYDEATGASVQRFFKQGEGGK